ncbi:hypothetical protein DUNSADRAFT_11532 [Dunaliella salina]|uniref:Encoded protein n=1 Tax=Dunaliella salina TaxID=3046 RepID=A0ABQ7GD50_DUNSA|nr:hypothetical protein DUNSADRAFT_11532 [Dunaliella salina]|eukprot:KAF5832538.1 hypothetical protein DUNSADRAFT_11532 [Dunaliella salina]
MFAFKDSMATSYSRLSLYLQIHNCTGRSCQEAACIPSCFGPQAHVKLHILDTLKVGRKLLSQIAACTNEGAPALLGRRMIAACASPAAAAW